MKFAFDYKKLHLRFLLGTGFVLFVLRKAVKRKDSQAAEELKPVCRQIKKLLKKYRRENGPFNLIEIEDKEKTRIVIRI